MLNSSKRYGSTKFEVLGVVQGVFFRKFTKAKAIELGLTGWCRNTPGGTVEGEFEYVAGEVDNKESNQSQSIYSKDNSSRCKVALLHRDSVAEFRHWLCKVGSPNSRIERCTFSDEVVSETQKFESFCIVR